MVIKLIFALGNPDQQYAGTRHNVGFLMVDRLARERDVSFAPKSKFKADIAEYATGETKVLIAKPTTYYNLVGESARAIMDFYKLTRDDIVIVHDDLALPLGTIRTRIGGSDAGNNGLKSLATHIGQETARIRIGTWHESHDQRDKVGVVLGKFTKEESAQVDAQFETIASLVDSFVADTFEATTHR